MGILMGRRQEPAEWSSPRFRRQLNMANDDKPQRRSKPGEAPRAKMKAAAPSSERPFDLWLQKQLHAMYDEIASEPLPSDLLDMIETDAKRKKKSDEPSSKN
jgi:hypothetical protein